MGTGESAERERDRETAEMEGKIESEREAAKLNKVTVLHKYELRAVKVTLWVWQ